MGSDRTGAKSETAIDVSLAAQEAEMRVSGSAICTPALLMLTDF